MHIVLDLIVVVIIVVTTLITMKKGFVKSILSIASLILTLAIISSFGQLIADAIYTGFVEDTVVSSVESTLDKQIETGEAAMEEIWESLPKFITNSAEKNDINTDSIIADINHGQTAKDIALSVNNNIVKPLVLPMLLIVVDIILFTVLMFVFKLLSKMICTLFKAPVLKSVNKALGIVLGIIKGLAISVLVCSVIAFIVDINSSQQFLIFNQAVIEDSYIFGKLASLMNITDIYMV